MTHSVAFLIQFRNSNYVEASEELSLRLDITLFCNIILEARINYVMTT